MEAEFSADVLSDELLATLSAWARERAERGAVFLDHQQPGWAESVRPARLNMEYGVSPSWGEATCVLCQVYDTSWYNVTNTALAGITQEGIHDYGFLASHDDVERLIPEPIFTSAGGTHNRLSVLYSFLNDAWTREVIRRTILVPAA